MHIVRRPVYCNKIPLPATKISSNIPFIFPNVPNDTENMYSSIDSFGNVHKIGNKKISDKIQSGIIWLPFLRFSKPNVYMHKVQVPQRLLTDL